MDITTRNTRLKKDKNGGENFTILKINKNPRILQSFIDFLKWIFTPPIWYNFLLFLLLSGILLFWDINEFSITGKFLDLEGFRTHLHITIIELFFLFLLLSVFEVIREIQRCKAEIDTIRDWTEVGATYKLCGLIKRLNRLHVSKMNLNNCFLPNADLQNINLQGSTLQGANLRGAKLINANLQGTNFWMADLQDALLFDANLHGANFRSANLLNANFAQANLVNVDFQEANLSKANLRNTNLQSANLQSTNLQDAKVYMANLEGGNLQMANLQMATLWKTNLTGANLSGANLTMADLQGTNLHGANLHGAKVCITNLRDSNLQNANMKFAIIWKTNLTGVNLGYNQISCIDWIEKLKDYECKGMEDIEAKYIVLEQKTEEKTQFIIKEMKPGSDAKQFIV